MTNDGHRRTLSRQSPAATVGDFFALLKPRVMSLVIFTGLAGIIVAPGSRQSARRHLRALLCIAIAAGASGALNMAYDSDIDALMTRTASRPIPMGHIARGDALAFGWTLAVGAVTMMVLFVNALAAGLLAFTIFFYVGVYTLWLKRRTPQNIVIGGLSGALPPAIGWAAVTGTLVVRAAVAGGDHLPVDAAAFLGAGAVPFRGLCARRRADDAGRQRQTRRRAARFCSTR